MSFITGERQIHKSALCITIHQRRIFMIVAMVSDFMPGIKNRFTDFREGVYSVSGNKKGGFDIIFFEQFQKPWYANLCTKLSS